MAKGKSAAGYERELREMIRERTGAECELWLMPQVRATAANMVILDKMQKEISEQKSLVTMGIGSTGQPMAVVHPLMPYYDKQHRTLMMQLEALGLNYKTTPKKITETTKKGGEHGDKLAELMDDIKNV